MIKNTIFCILWIVATINSCAQTKGELIDPRDGRVYKTLQIGNQIWMAENLAYKPEAGNYWAYNDEENNISKYGLLYDWQTAQNACPVDWHLPSAYEWETLSSNLEKGNLNIADVLKLQPSGYRHLDGTFNDLKKFGYWWSSTNDTSDSFFSFYYFSYNNDLRKSLDEENGFSVRCLKD